MRVPPEIRESVVFIGWREANGTEHRRGTGFFVSIEVPGADIPIPYLVTAQHVVEKCAARSPDGLIHLSFNTNDGGSKWITTRPDEWLLSSDRDWADVAVLPWWYHANAEMKFKHFPMAGALTQDVITSEGIGPGDELFLTGLFVKHAGKTRNIPIIRLGSIAAMPEEPIEIEDGRLVEAYLVETRSVGGLSGSPVFVRPLGLVDLPNKSGKHWTLVAGSRRFYLLGVMHGHWHVRPNASATQDEIVNMGIGIVTPSSRILPLLNCEGELAMQAEYVRRLQRGDRSGADGRSGLAPAEEH